MTIFTIAYNDYGKFLIQWIDNIKKQTIKPKVIIVLGKDHNADIETIEDMLKDYDYKIIHSDSEIMGTLRNLAVKEVKTDWMLYFSADDKLLPNAVENIINEDCNVVALRYRERLLNGREIHRESAIFTKDNMKDWKSNYVIPGYVAVKGKYYYEDIEIPNYPYMFMLTSKGLTQKHSKEECAIYQRRLKSHGYNSANSGRFVEFATIINNKAKEFSK